MYMQLHIHVVANKQTQIVGRRRLEKKAEARGERYFFLFCFAIRQIMCNFARNSIHIRESQMTRETKNHHNSRTANSKRQ